jgi:hypothetical protein
VRAFALTLGAFGWALALVPAALLVPVYSSKSSGPGGVVESSSTLVAENGAGVLLPIALPAVLAAVVWIALHRVCSRGSVAGRYVAWGLIGLMGAFCLLAAASIGVFVLPVVVLLACAAGATRWGQAPDAGR